jgi:hypothetical protein
MQGKKKKGVETKMGEVIDLLPTETDRAEQYLLTTGSNCS